jgi:hypothetical protein
MSTELEKAFEAADKVFAAADEKLSKVKASDPTFEKPESEAVLDEWRKARREVQVALQAVRDAEPVTPEPAAE